MSNFNVAEHHAGLCWPHGGPAMLPAVAAGLQDLYDQAYGFWVESGKPALPPCPDGAGQFMELPEFAAWLYEISPAGTEFYESLQALPMDCSDQFAANCFAFNSLLNALWHFS